jgi:dihydropteroate synthase
MGILNFTPDSFYDGGRYLQEDLAVMQVQSMLLEGASLIDIGGVSTRPFAAEVSEEEEMNRVIPILKILLGEFPDAWFSLDTWRSKVAERAIAAGVHLINDVSGSQYDPALIQVLADAQIPYVLMHVQGTPQTMQINPHYEDLMTEVLDYFIKKIDHLHQHGIYEILVDPGFGFGKNSAHNFELLARLKELAILGAPVLVGLSRKSMVYKTLDLGPEDALNGTTALHMAALMQGAKVLRAHDVREAMQTIALFEALQPHWNLQAQVQ